MLLGYVVATSLHPFLIPQVFPTLCSATMKILSSQRISLGYLNIPENALPAFLRELFCCRWLAIGFTI